MRTTTRIAAMIALGGAGVAFSDEYALIDGSVTAPDSPANSGLLVVRPIGLPATGETRTDDRRRIAVRLS